MRGTMVLQYVRGLKEGGDHGDGTPPYVRGLNGGGTMVMVTCCNIGGEPLVILVLL